VSRWVLEWRWKPVCSQARWWEAAWGWVSWPEEGRQEWQSQFVGNRWYIRRWLQQRGWCRFSGG